MKAIVSEYRKMRRIRINEYLLTIHLLWLPFHLYYKRSDLCVYNEYTYFSWTLLFQSLPNLVHWIRTNRPTRSASRALILVLYRPLSCWNSYFILSDNYKHVTYHNVRLLVQCHNVLHVPLNKPLQAIMEASNIDPKGWFAASKDKKYI